MEIKGRMCSLNDECVRYGLTRMYYEDIKYVRLVEGSNVFIVKGYQNQMNNVLGGLNRSRNHSANSGITTFELRLKEDEINAAIDIFKSRIPRVIIEDRPVKYSEGRRSFIGLTLLVVLAAIILFFLTMLGINLPSICSNAPVMFGGAAVFAVVINVIGFVTLDKQKMTKVFINGAW